VFVISVIICVVSLFWYRGILLESDPASSAPTLIALANSVQIAVFNVIYTQVAVWITDWENYQTET